MDCTVTSTRGVAILSTLGGQNRNFSSFFFYFLPFSSMISPYFLCQFGPLGGRLAHPGNPWLRHWRTSTCKEFKGQAYNTGKEKRKRKIKNKNKSKAKQKTKTKTGKKNQANKQTNKQKKSKTKNENKNVLEFGVRRNSNRGPSPGPSCTPARVECQM